MTEKTIPQGVSSQKWALVILALGLVVGLLVYGVREQTWLYGWRLGLTQAFILGGLAFALSAGPLRWRFPAIFALALTGSIGLLTVSTVYRFGHHTADFHASLPPSQIAQSIILGLIALTFFQTWHDSTAESGGNTWRSLSYERLFGNIWENLLAAAVSFCFLGLLWLLLWLFASLFESVGVGAFAELIGEPFFSWPVSCGAFVLGVHFTQAYDRIVAALHSIVFALFSILAPVFLVLSASFLVVLFLGGFERLASLVSASTTLLVLTGFGLVFVNAVIRDGKAEDRQHGVVRISAMLLLPCLVFFCGFAVYAIGLRINQYGLTPDRIFVAITTALLTLGSFAYLASLVARSRWMNSCRGINIGLALLVAVAVLVLQTPLADPYRLSADSQYRRLVSGTADAATFDYGFLKFGLGRAGADALERISNDSGAASREIVVKRLSQLARVEHRWDWSRIFRNEKQNEQLEALSDPARVRRIPNDLILPKGLTLDRILHLERCGKAEQPDCLIATVDLTDSGGDELLFAMLHWTGNAELFLFERQGEGWITRRLTDISDGEATIQTFLNGEFGVVPADHQDLRIGNKVLRLRKGSWEPLEDLVD